MKKIMIALLLVGCSTTPDPVRNADFMQGELLSILEHNVSQNLDNSEAMIRELLNNQFTAHMQIEEQKLLNPDGTVNLKEYKLLQKEQQAAILASEIKMQEDFGEVNNLISRNIATIKLLQMMQAEYNSVTGISQETFDQFVDFTSDTVKSVDQLLEERKERKAEASKDRVSLLSQLLKQKQEEMEGETDPVLRFYSSQEYSNVYTLLVNAMKERKRGRK